MSRYEITIEALDAAGRWNVIVSAERNEPFIEFNFLPGEYRWRVTVFDMLGRKGDVSDWAFFSVKSNGTAAVAGEGSASAGTAAASEPDNSARGTNSAGAAIAANGIASNTAAPSVFSLEMFYAPSIPLPVSDFNEIYSDAILQPAGIALRAVFMPFKKRARGLGFALSPLWTFLSNETNESTRYTHIAALNFLVLYKLPLPSGVSLNFAAGGGVSYLFSHFEFYGGESADERRAFNPCVLAALTLGVRLGASLELIAGVEYFQIIARDNSYEMFIRPIIGLGWGM